MWRIHREGRKDLDSELQRYAAWLNRRQRELEREREREDEEQVRATVAARRSIHHVRVALDREMVVLPWESRQALLSQFRHRDSMQDVLIAFEAVGTSELVRLSHPQKFALLQVIEVWSAEVAGRADGGSARGDLRPAERSARRPPRQPAVGAGRLSLPRGKAVPRPTTAAVRAWSGSTGPTSLLSPTSTSRAPRSSTRSCVRSRPSRGGQGSVPSSAARVPTPRPPDAPNRAAVLAHTGRLADRRVAAPRREPADPTNLPESLDVTAAPVRLCPLQEQRP